ncbi:MAG: adenosylmethionine--8-amino-7-oxononanoate transaminase [bacterium]
MQSLVELDKRHLWHPFTRMATWLEEEPLIIERAEGHYLYDTQGRRYFDGVSSLWVNLFGHRRPELDDAIQRQLRRVAHSTLLGLSGVPAIELAAALVDRTYARLSRVFYSDNGSTAVEVALKMAYQYWQIVGRTEKRRFLALSDAYHGDTLGSVSVGGIDLFHRIFHPLLFNVARIPSPYWYRHGAGDDPEACRNDCLQALQRTLAEQADELAALVIEPLVQGAAGIIVHPEGYLREAVRLCREHDVLVIFDEVAVGFGRTGTMFAGEQEGVEPDLLALAKGISGGYLPLAATLATEQLFEAFQNHEGELGTFFHGHSYTGNALACAAGLASLQIFEREDILDGVLRKAGLLKQLLEQQVAPLRHCGQIRQKGLMVGIELVRDRASRQPYPAEALVGARVCKRIRELGVMLRPLGSVIVLIPPLTTTEEELAHLVGATARGIREETE